MKFERENVWGYWAKYYEVRINKQVKYRTILASWLSGFFPVQVTTKTIENKELRTAKVLDQYN